MIWTVTLNPAIDYILHSDQLAAGTINRPFREEYHFGGKGVNVSRVLHSLGQESTALGFIAGFTGRVLAEGLGAQSIKSDFITLKKGLTRMNIKLVSGGQTTEINGAGPEADQEALNRLLEKLSAVQDGDILVLSGSLPGGLSKDTYGRILAAVSHRNIRAVVDAEGDALLAALPYKPYLVKPNLRELEGIFKVSCNTPDEVLKYGEALQKKGPRNVLITLGNQGSLLLTEDGTVFRTKVPEAEIVNPMGAGDSLLAGFLTGLLENGDPEHALALGNAAGMAAAAVSGLAEKEAVETHYSVTKSLTCQIQGGNEV